MANSFSFGGTDMAGSSYGVTVERTPIAWGAQPVLDVQTAPSSVAVSQAMNHSPRTITLNCVCIGTSASDLITKLDNIAGVINSELGEQSLAIDQISGRYWNARLASEFVPEFAGKDAARFTLSFLAADPFAFGDTLTTSEDTIATDPDTFTETPGGSAYAHPIWLVYNNTGGNVTGDITVSNTTTGEAFTWNGSLDNQEWLKVDPDPGNYSVERSTDTGEPYTSRSWEDVISGWQGPLWPRLQAGVSNSVTVSGISTGKLLIVYRDRYL